MIVSGAISDLKELESPDKDHMTEGAKKEKVESSPVAITLPFVADQGEHDTSTDVVTAVNDAAI